MPNLCGRLPGAHVDPTPRPPRSPGRIGSVKAKPVACLERPPADTSPLLSDLDKTEIPPPARKTFDAEGEILEHALMKSLRIRNEAIKSLCSSLGRFRQRHHQGRMQKRLSARSSGPLESFGAGGGSHSELSHLRTDEPRRRNKFRSENFRH